MNLGGKERIKEIPNGLMFHPFTTQRGEGDGIILIMLRRGIPVIHLLNVIRLAQKNGMLKDPGPLPSIQYIPYIP